MRHKDTTACETLDRKLDEALGTARSWCLPWGGICIFCGELWRFLWRGFNVLRNHRHFLHMAGRGAHRVDGSAISFRHLTGYLFRTCAPVRLCDF